MAGEELQQLSRLRLRVEKVSNDIHKAIDGNQLSEDGRKDMEELSNVLHKIKGRLTPQDHHDDSGKKDTGELLPPSKREELDRLLEEIERALRQRKQRQPESSEHAVQRKKMLSAAMVCNPFSKLMSPSLQEKKSREQGGGRPQEEEEEDEAASLKLLVRLAQHVLEPEQYYEWTTSYVDESRIYGWDTEAGEVVEALVGPEDGDFRAAAITGIHGSGKTALAQKVFVHDKVKDNFPIRLWVCVGPPDSEDRFNLLYRMLDNLGLDTNRIEDVVVHGAQVVENKRKEERAKITQKELDVLRNKAKEEAQREEAQRNKAKEEAQKPDDATKNQEDAKAEEERIFQELLKKVVDDTPAVRTSKIGVLLYILHMALSKTGYLIVFDDIRVYGDDGWYSNLTLPPPAKGEWGDRLAYGLPKTATKHRNAVLVTCRKEDDARAMVRTGRVFRPPKLKQEKGAEDGWKLFEREYKQAKANKGNKDQQEDLLFKELEQMKKEIVDKCLGLPVAIIEAAKGFALSGLEPLPDPPLKKAAEDQIGSTSNKDIQADDDKPAVQTIE